VADPTSEDLAFVLELLPDDASEYNWNASKALERWAGTIYRTVREYWLDRTNDTAGYLDLTNDGLPASQLHAQAKAMLEYWDELIASTEAAEEAAEDDLLSNQGTTSRLIRRV